MHLPTGSNCHRGHRGRALHYGHSADVEVEGREGEQLVPSQAAPGGGEEPGGAASASSPAFAPFLRGWGRPSEAARAARQVSIPTDHPLSSAAPRSSLLGTRTRQGWFSELQTQTHVQPSTASEPQKIKTHPRFSGTAPISNIQTRKHSRPPAPDRAGFQQGPRPPPCPLRLRSRLEGEGRRTVLPTHLALG